MKPDNPAANIDLQKLIDAPLADPLNLNVPLGKRVIKQGPRARYYDGIDAPRLKQSELQARREDAFSKKLCAVLDYYAGSAVPIERVAEHTRLSIEQATDAMRRRGRMV